MYINEIIQYLIWPAFILICWFVIKFALSAYEKKFPEMEESVGNKADGKD